MNPSEFVDVAVHLAGHLQPVEGCKRSAVSRYYYAAFLETRDQLRTKRNFRFKGRDSHNAVIISLGRSPDNDLRKSGLKLEQLRSSRNKADYDIQGNTKSASVSEASQLAAQVIDVVTNNSLVKAVDPKVATWVEPAGSEG